MGTEESSDIDSLGIRRARQHGALPLSTSPASVSSTIRSAASISHTGPRRQSARLRRPGVLRQDPRRNEVAVRWCVRYVAGTWKKRCGEGPANSREIRGTRGNDGTPGHLLATRVGRSQDNIGPCWVAQSIMPRRVLVDHCTRGRMSADVVDESLSNNADLPLSVRRLLRTHFCAVIGSPAPSRSASRYSTCCLTLGTHRGSTII